MLSYIRSCILRERCVIPCSPVRKAAGRVDAPIFPKQNVWYYLRAALEHGRYQDSLGLSRTGSYSFITLPAQGLTLLRVS